MGVLWGLFRVLFILIGVGNCFALLVCCGHVIEFCLMVGTTDLTSMFRCVIWATIFGSTVVDVLFNFLIFRCGFTVVRSDGRNAGFFGKFAVRY